MKIIGFSVIFFSLFGFAFGQTYLPLATTDGWSTLVGAYNPSSSRTVVGLAMFRTGETPTGLAILNAQELDSQGRLIGDAIIDHDLRIAIQPEEERWFLLGGDPKVKKSYLQLVSPNVQSGRASAIQFRVYLINSELRAALELKPANIASPRLVCEYSVVDPAKTGVAFLNKDIAQKANLTLLVYRPGFEGMVAKSELALKSREQIAKMLNELLTLPTAGTDGFVFQVHSDRPVYLQVVDLNDLGP